MFSAERTIVPLFAAKVPFVKSRSALNVIMPEDAVKVVPAEVTRFGFTSTFPSKVNELPLEARVIVLPVPVIKGT